MIETTVTMRKWIENLCHLFSKHLNDDFLILTQNISQEIFLTEVKKSRSNDKRMLLLFSTNEKHGFVIF